MDNYVLGIDLGLKGGLALIQNNKRLIAVEPIPTIESQIGKKLRNIYDLKAIHDLIAGWNADFTIVKAGMERLRAIPGQMSQTAFSMGFGSGVFKTLLTSLGIPFIEIEPRQWQKEIFGQLGIQYTKETTKQASIQAAKQLFPYMDFLRTERSRKADDGLCDSANIALYTLLKDI